MSIYKRNLRKKMSLILLSSMMATQATPVFAKDQIMINLKNIDKEQNDIDMSMYQIPPIDLTLAVGESDLNIDKFEEDIIKELEKRNISKDSIVINTTDQSFVSSNATNAEEIFKNWGRIGFAGQWSFNNSTKEIVNSENTDNFTGFYYPDSFNFKDIDFSYKNTSFNTDDDTMGAMIRFNKEADGTVTTYVFALTNKNQNVYANIQCGLYKIVKKPFQYAQITPLVKHPIKTWTRSKWSDYRFVAKGNTIQVYMDNALILEYTDNNNPIMTGSYGFFSFSQPDARFKDVNVYTTNTKSFKDVLYNVAWQDDSMRFIVNLNDEQTNDFEKSSALSEILTKTINEDIHYIGWGSEENKEQNQKFIKANNNKGIVLNSSEYDESIGKIVDYIASQIDNYNEIESESNNIIIGNDVSIQVYPEELKESSANEANPYGRWRTIHDYEYFENHEGQAPFSGLYQDALDIEFTKSGKYDILFDGQVVKTLIVHRKPMANYQAKLNGLSLEIIEDSFDVDNISKSNQGIIDKEWKWKETTEDEWRNGFPPTTLEADKDYVIQLSVKDEQETWSNPTTKYVSTRNIQSTPISEFSIKNTSFTKYQTLEVTNNSYDPTGKSINEQEWILKKNNSQVYKGSTLPVDYNTSTYGEGEYALSLRVKNNEGTWSESFTRKFIVTKDITAPELIISTPTKSWGDEAINLSVQVKDNGGSDLAGSRYAITQSQDKPSDELFTEWTNADNLDIIIEEEGTHFVHIQSKDNDDNLTYRVVGPYQIDRSAPTLTHTLNNSDPTNANILITVTATDELSGLKHIILPDETVVAASQTTYEVKENGTYIFKAVDKVGNEDTYEVEVSNIDKTLPTISHELSTDDWTDEYVDIHLTGDKEYGRIILPDGEFVMGTETTYRVYDNGDYTFKLADFAGNEVTYTVTIDSFDRVKPEGTFMINQGATKWIHDRNVVLSLDFIDEGSGIDYIDILETYEKKVPKTKIIEAYDETGRTTSAAISLDLRYLAISGADDEILNDSTSDKEDVSLENDLDENLDEPTEDLELEETEEQESEIDNIPEDELEDEVIDELDGETQDETEDEIEEDLEDNSEEDLDNDLEDNLEEESDEELEEDLEDVPEVEPDEDLEEEIEEEEFDTVLVSQSKRIDIRDNVYKKDISWVLSEGLGLKSFTVRVVDKLGNAYSLESDVTLVEAPAAPGLGDAPVIIPTPDEPEETPDVPVIPNEPETTPGDDVLDDKDNDADNDSDNNSGNNDDDNDDYYYIVSKKPSINTNKDKNTNKENEVIKKNETIKPLEISYVVFTRGANNYVVDNQVILADSCPILKDGRIYIPIRHLSNALNITNDNIKWIPETRQVIIHDGHDELTLRIGDRYAILNGERIEMDGAAFIDGDRVFLPISQIKEVFRSRSLEVDWMESSKQAVISFKKQ